MINVRTYSPTLDRYETDADSEFSLWYTMGGATMAPIGEASVPAGGGQVSWTWQGLKPGRIHQWYANLGGANLSVNCPVQQFVTSFAASDLNRDGDVNQLDVSLFLGCFTGDKTPYELPGFPGECPLAPETDGTIPADRDKDGDVDQKDFGALQRCLGATACAD